MITATLLITVVLLAIAGLANSGMDVLTYSSQTFIFQSDWWHKRGRFAWDKRKWYTKYIFTMVSDGWHFLKFINIISYVFAIVVLVNLTILILLIQVLIYYTLIGLMFELGYKFLWRKSFWQKLKIFILYYVLFWRKK